MARRWRAVAVAVSVSGWVLLPLATGPAQATGELTAVRDLQATTSGDQATVSWQRPAIGMVARYQIQALLDGNDYGTRIVGPGTTRISWDRIPFNQPVQFLVTPIGPNGPGGSSGPAGLANETGTVTATNSYCPVTSGTDCVVVNPFDSVGTETHPGSGLLNGTVSPSNPWVAALHINHWRISAANTTAYNQAAAQVPASQITELLSAVWSANTSWLNLGFAADPWANWTAYTDSIKAAVAKAKAAGENPYWDIQNEPETYPYSPSEPPTRALVLQQYLEAYQAIKSVDKNARIVGPSINWQYDNASAPWYIDMKSFITFAATHGMKLAALSWHENSDLTDSNPPDYMETPQVVRDHAEVVKELVAENPGIGKPQLFINENSSGAGAFIPGFAVGYVAEEERAGIAQANRSCWGYPATSALEGCFGPTLSNLLNPDSAPTASYWAMVDYAAMTGTRVWSDSTDAQLSSLAVSNTAGTVHVLLGRHSTCSSSTVGAARCAGGTPAPPVATTAAVLLPRGASSARVSAQEIPNTVADLGTPPRTSTYTVPVTDGVARLRLPSFPDGAAYFLTVTPNTRAGAVPASGNHSSYPTPSPAGTPTPTRLVVESGDSQTGQILQSLPSIWQVLVVDQYGSPMANAPVTFTLPPNVAAFPGGASRWTVRSDSRGVASSPPIIAGADPNYYTGTVQVAPRGPTLWFGFSVVL